jgi:hypothetical protein
LANIVFPAPGGPIMILIYTILLINNPMLYYCYSGM